MNKKIKQTILILVSIIIVAGAVWILLQKAPTEAQGPSLNVPEELKAALVDPEKLAGGKLIFNTQCIVCHGNLGQGSTGPNLTDNYWKHGKGTLEDIYAVIDAGVLDEGMPAWGRVFRKQDVINLSAYVKSLQGTNPPGAKAPEGELSGN